MAAEQQVATGVKLKPAAAAHEGEEGQEEGGGRRGRALARR